MRALVIIMTGHSQFECAIWWFGAEWQLTSDGKGQCNALSRRPGRSSAGSMRSGRLVAARTYTPTSVTHYYHSFRFQQKQTGEGSLIH